MSEAYTLQRQTFYLAQDYFDRFMLTQDNIEKGMLQLIGITCLFLASKMEVRGHGSSGFIFHKSFKLNDTEENQRLACWLHNAQQPVEEPLRILC